MMRRTVLGWMIGLMLTPAVAFAASPAPQAEQATQETAMPQDGLSPGGTIDYTPEIHDFVRQSKKPYILDFYANWCGTCRAQERAIDRLRAKNRDYNDITILKVNWDAYRAEPVARDLNVPRRSTLVLLTGDAEIDRIVASTRMRDIKNLLDRGLRYEP